ncbi:MAG: hypothetical protein ACON30_07620 [Flavobacteriaceae bacterium]
MKTTLIFLMTLLLTTGGCTKDEHKDPQTIRFTEIGKGYLSGNGAEGIEKSNLVIKTKTEWETLMQKMNTSGNVTDNFTETDIDFNTYMVIAVFDAVKMPPSSTTIEQIKNHNNINIIYTIVDSDATVAIFGQSFHIIKMPTSNQEIMFNLNTQ